VSGQALLDRLRSERRWAIALFIGVGLFIAAVQFALAPGAQLDEGTGVVAGPRELDP